MTGYILKKECAIGNFDLTIDRPVFKDMDTEKHYVFCHGGGKCSAADTCFLEVDITYALKRKRRKREK